MHRRWNLCTCLSEIWTTTTVWLSWWLWKMNTGQPQQLSPLRSVIVFILLEDSLKKPIWAFVSIGVAEGAEKQQLGGGSPDYIGRHGEPVRATGPAHWWSSWTDFHLSVWYAQHWGLPRSDRRKDGGNAVMLVRPPYDSGEVLCNDNAPLPFSWESKCWPKWAQFCWTHPATQLTKWK